MNKFDDDYIEKKAELKRDLHKIHSLNWYYNNTEHVISKHKEKYRDDESFRENQKKKSKDHYQCSKVVGCNRFGKNGAERYIFNCEVCGIETARRVSNIKNTLPRFCSKKCHGISQRKGYVSPYEKKLKDLIKKYKS